MEAAAILNLFELEIASLDPPSPKTQPYSVSQKKSPLRFFENFPNGWEFLIILADRTNGRAIATLLRLSSVVCDVMYCG